MKLVEFGTKAAGCHKKLMFITEINKWVFS